MKALAVVLLVLAAAVPGRGNTGSGTLTLVNESGVNRLTITVSATTSGLTASDTQTTTVTGTIDAAMDTHPTTGRTVAFTLTDGNVSMTNMRFVLKALIFITVADISTSNMGGRAYTPEPVPAPAVPDPVTATKATFDAALHRFVINKGTISGAITYTDPDTPVSADFAASPVEGAGTGTGTITMVPGVADATHRTFQATVQIPVDFTDTQDMDGTPVSIRVRGTLKAAGPVRIPLLEGMAAAPVLSLPGGAYPVGQEVVLTPAAGTVVHYRVNGGDEQTSAAAVTGLKVPAYPGTLRVTAFARRDGMYDSAPQEVTYAGMDSYGNWLTAAFPGVTDLAVSTPEADPDGDGWSNLLEFALGGSPADRQEFPRLIPLQPVSDEPLTAESWVFTVAVRAGAPPFAGEPFPEAGIDGMRYMIEGGLDPTRFDQVVVPAPNPAHLATPPAGYEFRSFRLQTPAKDGYFRVKVEKDEG